MYGKLFTSMYDGTLRVNWKALVTFQQMICLCDSEGVLDMTPVAIHGRTGIPLDIIEEGIQHLEAPDPYSRTPDMDGRRIERLDAHRPWGWRIINHAKYRDLVNREDKREADRTRIAEKRRLAKGEQMSLDVAGCSGMSQGVADVAHADTDTDTDEDITRSVPDPAERLFEVWKAEYNHPRSKLDSKRKKKIQAALKLGYSPAELERAIKGYKNSPHHMGKNESSTVYDDIELFLRDAKHIDQGLSFAAREPVNGGHGTDEDPWKRGPSRGIHS